jgi:radical SAM family protein
MQVLFVHLPLARRSYLSRFALPEPIAPLYFAPLLAPRHDVRLLDLRLGPASLSEALERSDLRGFQPRVAAVGVNPLYYRAADRTLAELRSHFPGIRILLFADAEYGNSHVTERPREFAHPLADALVEPYFLASSRPVVTQAIDALQRDAPWTEVAGLWVQRRPGDWVRTESVANRVGDIGIPQRSLMGRDRGRYRFGGIGRMAHVFYTYGCRFKCRFCPMSKHDGSIIARSLEEIVPELAELTEPHLFLQDYEPFLLPEAMEALAAAVEREGIRKSWYMLTRSDTALAQEALIARWKKLGLRWLYLGIDGHTPERVKEIRKANTLEAGAEAIRRMRALGLAVTVGFVVRSDFTREDFVQLRATIRRLDPPLVGFSVETPLVGTKLFDDTEGELTTRDASLFDLEHAVLPTSLPLGEFYGELASLAMATGMRSLPALLRHYPLRDIVRTLAQGPAAVRDLRNSASDHASADRSAPAPAPAHPAAAYGAR